MLLYLWLSLFLLLLGLSRKSNKMSKHKEGMFSMQLIKRGSSLVHENDSIKELYRRFTGALQEGQKVEVFLDVNIDDGTLAQLAKIHKCIREIASETGSSFDDMKIRIKKEAGLCIRKEFEGESFMICKSFADCSKAELALVIEAIIQRGDYLNINMR